MHDLDAAQGLADAVRVADVTFNELDLLRARRILPEIDDPDGFTALAQPPGNQITKEAGPTGNKMPHERSRLVVRVVP